jgi:hypothetical protein
VVVVSRDRDLGPIGLDEQHLVWESGRHEGEALATSLYLRDRRSRETRIVARGTDSTFGLAAAAGWIVFARAASTGERLLARNGATTLVLTRALAAPLAARGNFVAWAEQSQRRQRVVLRNMATGANWLAAAFPRCRNGRCYRIDAVTVADRGVVFTRDPIGADTSMIVRRAFTAAKTTTLTLTDDPQPDLVPSSAGALYYRFNRGWFRWDFGKRRPARTPYSHARPAPLVAYEHGRWFLDPQTGCSQTLEARRDGDRVISLTDLRALQKYEAAGKRKTCRELGGFAWTGRQALAAWRLTPRASEEEHESTGLVSVLTSTTPPGRRGFLRAPHRGARADSATREPARRPTLA